MNSVTMISFIIMTKKQLSQLFLIHISETDSACQSTNMGALCLLFFCVRISDVYIFFLVFTRKPREHLTVWLCYCLKWPYNEIQQNTFLMRLFINTYFSAGSLCVKEQTLKVRTLFLCSKNTVWQCSSCW